MSDLKVTTATNGEAAAAAKSSSADIAKGHLLMLVLDINPNQLLFARRPKLLLKWLDAALAVANSHLMLHPNNAVAAVAAHSQGCTFLYPGPSEATATGDSAAAGPSILRQRDGQFEAFYRVESAIRKEVTRILVAETGSVVSGCIKLLHYMYRLTKVVSEYVMLTSIWLFHCPICPIMLGQLQSGQKWQSS